MLAELRVSQLGVIEDTTIVFGPGMTALTGETGAGKTLLVDAIALLLGGPTDPTLVRPGASEAIVEARVEQPDGDGEVILTRIIPVQGRSRCYLDGRMVSAAALAEAGSRLVDLHGQHAHQSLLASSAQRTALDQSAGLSVEPLTEARRQAREIRSALESLGGDQRARARELDVLRYQLQEVESAGLDDPEEDRSLRVEEDTLSDASGLRLAVTAAWEDLRGDGGVIDDLGTVVGHLSGRAPFDALRTRLATLQDELQDVATECRSRAEGIEDDPARLAAIGSRRQVLADLRRKYGDTLAEVIEFREDVRTRVHDLESYEERAAALERRLTEADAEVDRCARELWEARRRAAPVLAEAIQSRLAELAMAQARFEVAIGEEPGSDEVVWMLGANPGEPVLPLTKVASGGELARTMLASRLAVGPYREGSEAGPATLVFDEVDAGIGGEAAVAVGQALAALAPDHQVLVVTHLAQVAAYANQQIVVTKSVTGDRTIASVEAAEGPDRIVELSRMLSGSPDSETARNHAEELLARAGKGTGRSPRRGKRLR